MRSNKVLESKCKHCNHKTNNLVFMKVHRLKQHSNKKEIKIRIRILFRKM